VPNRLASATSPYLLQHADNPVDWWEWGEDAFAAARERGVPVTLVHHSSRSGGGHLELRGTENPRLV
jgi:hypothetical protein